MECGNGLNIFVSNVECIIGGRWGIIRRFGVVVWYLWDGCGGVFGCSWLCRICECFFWFNELILCR